MRQQLIIFSYIFLKILNITRKEFAYTRTICASSNKGLFKNRNKS